MMNQVEGTGTQDGVALEADKLTGSNQVHTSSMASLHAQWENQSSKENGVLSSAVENHSQEVDQTLKTAENGTNAASYLSTPSSGPPNSTQTYSGQAGYSNSYPYISSSTGYTSYYNQYQHANPYEQQTIQYQQQTNQYHHQPNTYQQPTNQYQQQTNQYQQPANQYQQQTTQYQQQPNHYQQQSNPSYSHQVGAYHNTGVPYQPLSSFQNTGSYSGSASYSSTYYNPGDYQTSGSYTSGTYGTQANPWHEGQYAAYGSHQYATYTSDSTAAYGSSPAAANSQYQQQHYKQWDDYYRQTQTEVSCAPGTEHLSATNASSVNFSFPAAITGYTASNNQVPAAHSTVPGPQYSSNGSASFQSPVAYGGIPEGHQQNVVSVSHDSQKPPEVLPNLEISQNLQSSSFQDGSAASYPTSYQFTQSHQLSFPTVFQPPEPLDSHRASKLQIPTNPRIVSKLPLFSSKNEKNSLTATAAAKPAYVSVSQQKPGEADFMLKPGAFPKSLRGYVERALARCKSDRQKIACQDIMKEVITKATADGTLHTKDWDSEPIFPLPDVDVVDKQVTFQFPVSSVPKNGSPSRRTKSRWEPISEGKLVGKSNNVSYQNAKSVGWNSKQFLNEKPEYEYNSGTNVSSRDLKISSKNVMRPAKRPRVLNAHAHSDAETSSDSEERSLTKYSLAAIALADTPEEKERRESRTKRFDKKHGNRIENSNIKAKVARAGNLYARQVGALGLVRTSEDSGSRAVEDIDWDAFTVKGTCQEIEKRYLRLTSAPDPAMVRPEEVLEKALTMVQNSQKNYLYKCDQLKSIRQDLTVQRIRNELTVKVYETHARLAIEVGDLPEYNQCQSQLKTLYGEGIKGCHMEFAAYNLLLVILHSNNNRDLLSAMSSLPSEAKKDKAVQHALSVRAAVTCCNYVMFFRLYKTAPNLNSLFMDLYVEKIRYAAIKCICRSYRPTVPVSYLSQILGFNNTSPETEASEEKDMECVEWLKAHGAVLTSENSCETLVDTKASIQSLYIPEPEDAVAHGDANLAVNDFFTRSLA